jgi:G3E family GTPase
MALQVFYASLRKPARPRAYPGATRPALAIRIASVDSQRLMTETFGNPWLAGEAKASNLVFIGRNLPKQDMLEALQACQVSN